MFSLNAVAYNFPAFLSPTHSDPSTALMINLAKNKEQNSQITLQELLSITYKTIFSDHRISSVVLIFNFSLTRFKHHPKLCDRFDLIPHVILCLCLRVCKSFIFHRTSDKSSTTNTSGEHRQHIQSICGLLDNLFIVLYLQRKKDNTPNRKNKNVFSFQFQVNKTSTNWLVSTLWQFGS